MQTTSESYDAYPIDLQLNPSHSNIIMHILHTVLYTFPRVLTRRICLTTGLQRKLLQLVIYFLILVISITLIRG